ncbi:hypothetical protein [Spiroplasma cantharicola]|uniref:Uncharacterized protein n=1 Tax=Spiroplasma cantharicola TaxID=362837 RepID=A0A0M4JIA4_9MOLU|nr:hypothetical protein [Spiroplasma cantharicola]ALD66291.1 hypothetical protein SCANT_v1c03810 [Spiroplasma cantharicola]
MDSNGAGKSIFINEFLGFKLDLHQITIDGKDTFTKVKEIIYIAS